ncbi:protein-export membrane protein SecG [bacterium BMS3Abin05]|nr:protein-export membrane protein SecG [bacterium BMS3Abin05]GBE26838.1 protein-export membrane protein SecG [bacterium BMS3Bbin03]HDZ11542.1 preprotein translocase subunit SecG [Bacteroidota bacterium]
MFLIVTFHIILCFVLTIVILLQSSKGGGLSGAFGGGGGAAMGAVFGGRGAGTFLSKATVVLATLFFLSNITQVLIIKQGPAVIQKSLVRKEMEKEGKMQQSLGSLLPPIKGEKKSAPPLNAPTKTRANPAPAGNGKKNPQR